MCCVDVLLHYITVPHLCLAVGPRRLQGYQKLIFESIQLHQYLRFRDITFRGGSVTGWGWRVRRVVFVGIRVGCEGRQREESWLISVVWSCNIPCAVVLELFPVTWGIWLMSFVCASVYLSACLLSISLSACLSVFLCVCLFVYTYLAQYLFLLLFLLLFLHLSSSVCSEPP